MNEDIKNDDIIDILLNLTEKIDSLIFDRKSAYEWYPVSVVATSRGLSNDAVRKQLQSGNFEEGVDFKYNGSRIEVHQGAIERIHRKRRSSSG